MATLTYDKDIDDSILRDKTVAVLGYGSQGHAHALNLKDSGFNVIVGLYEGSRSKQSAEEAGLEVVSNAEATKRADLISFCLQTPFRRRSTWKTLSPTSLQVRLSSSPTVSRFSTTRSSPRPTSTLS